MSTLMLSFLNRLDAFAYHQSYGIFMNIFDIGS